MDGEIRQSAVSRVIVVGAGGHGKELGSYLLDLKAGYPSLDFIGYVDDHRPPGPFGACRVLGDLRALQSLLDQNASETIGYITAVGDNRVRHELVDRLVGMGAGNLVPWTLKHPSALVGHDVSIGVGTCLAPASIVTTHVAIGNHCILNVHASVSHDSRVGDFVNINPGACVNGNVTIGEGAFIGSGVTVRNGVSIGAWTIVGAGAVVVSDLPPHVTAVGVPARVIKSHERWGEAQPA